MENIKVRVTPDSFLTVPQPPSDNSEEIKELKLSLLQYKVSFYFVLCCLILTLFILFTRKIHLWD